MSFLYWNGTPPSGGSENKVVLYLYSTDAGDPMRLNDTGPEGCSVMAAAVAAMTDSLGNTYSISEIDDTVFDPTIHLAGVDVLITGSSNKLYSTPHRDAIMAWVNAGGAIIGYSDNGINGGGVTAHDSRDSMGFDAILGVQFGPDQFDGVRTYTLPSNSVLGNALQVRGEGTSPFRLKSPYDIAGATVTVLNNHHSQSPANTSGVTYTGVWAAIAVGTYGAGRFVCWFDRQMTWNAGAGSSITEVANQTFVLNSIRWAATGISQS